MQHALSTSPNIRSAGLLRRGALALVALAIALLAQQRIGGGSGWDAILLFAVALAAFLVAFPRASEPLAVGAKPLLRNSLLLYGGLALCAAALALTLVALPRFTTDKPAEGGWTLHLAAVAAVTLGGLLLDFAFARNSEGAPRRWALWATLLLITAIAAALRLTRLETLPFGIWYDEAENALAAQDILRNASYRPFYLGSTFHTAHHNYMVAAAFRWLGESISSARLVSAIMGILMVPAACLVAFELFWTTPSHARRASWVPPVMGLLFAAVLTVSTWALNFSRIAVNYTATPLFVLLATGFLLRGLRTQHLSAYLLSGLALGMGLNFYSSFRLFLPVLPLFVGAALIARRDLWGKSWRGLILLSLAALIVATPLITFAVTNRETFLSRSTETFLLKNKAPEDRLPALLGNARTHLLMFNVRGDPNGRHNLPGRPMLDPTLGALFAVGLGVCLWRWRRPGYLLLPIWLGLTLLGGILTLDFEAPQSLRSNGAIPAAMLIALTPVAELLRAWERSDGGRYTPRLGPLLAVALLIPVAGWNLREHFVTERTDFAVWNAFSTAETLTARTLATLDPAQSEAYVISYYHGHPTLHFLVPHWREQYRRLESTDPVPLVWPPDKDVWLFMDVDSEVLFRKLQSIYPTAEIVEHSPPFAETVTMRQVHLSRAVIESVQGLNVRTYANNRWQGEPQIVTRAARIDADWEAEPPLPLPFSVEYEGVLRVTTFGPHSFRLLAPGRAELLIDETRVLAGSGELSGGVTLAQGNHAIRLRAVGGNGLLQLAWRPPDREAEVLPTSYLFTEPVTANGLLGRFFPNDSWQPPETLATIDPQINIIYHITPINRPFTVEWTGKLAVPESGDYLFSVQAIDSAEVEVDGVLVASALNAQMTADGGAYLEEGLHDIRILYAALSSHSRISVYWTPPGGARSPIPSALLFPPQQSYDRIEVPSFAMLAPQLAVEGETNTEAAQGNGLLGPLLPGESRILMTGLSRPSGIASGGDGRLAIADTEDAQLLIATVDGQGERTITGGDDPFVEPFDVAVGPEDELYLLDTEAATIVVFDATGDLLRTIRPDPALVGRSRGLHVDAEGLIWIANTPGQRIVVLDGEGALVREFPIWPGEEAQVVDVVTTADRRIFATALGVDKLIQFDETGRRLMTWDIPTANTMDGPHLAVDGASALYVTQPEESRIVVIEPDGTRRGYYQLAQGAEMVKPVGIAVDGEGRIVVGDTQGGRVVRITPP